jgi:hypothetical protein
VLLERAPGAGLGLERLPGSPLPLFPHALLLRNHPNPRQHLFEVLGDVADAVAVYRLRAGQEVPPEALADMVQGAT